LRSNTPLRKELKDAAKAARTRPADHAPRRVATHDDWELTVGIEIHAQLNAARKLFSRMFNSTCYSLNGS
jgi:aspartyl-tRNA(Asn)/glutamyl-tRNA(Gln) amidotransferase subunit B